MLHLGLRSNQEILAAIEVASHEGGYTFDNQTGVAHFCRVCCEHERDGGTPKA